MKSLLKYLNLSCIKLQVNKINRLVTVQRFNNTVIKRVKSTRINLDKVFELLESKNYEPSMSEEYIKVKICPMCTKPHNDDPTNFHTMNIHKEKMVFNCFRCGCKGHLATLIKKINAGSTSGMLSGASSMTESEDFKYTSYSKNEQIEQDYIIANEPNDQTINFSNSYSSSSFNRNSGSFNSSSTPYPSSYHSHSSSSKNSISNNQGILEEMFKRIQGVDNSNTDIIKDYIEKERKLKLETIKFFKVGMSFEKFSNLDSKLYNIPCVTYPMYFPLNLMQVLKPHSEVINEEISEFFKCDKFYLSRMKVRAIGKELKKFQRSEPSGALFPGLFGLDLVDEKEETICITEGEYDAMAVYQETKIPSVSLPNGCTSLPNELLPYFNRFKKIYLWMDADQAGKIASENFAKVSFTIKHLQFV